MVYIYKSTVNNNYFLSRVEQNNECTLVQITQNEKGVYKVLKGKGVSKEQVDKMFEVMNNREVN